MTCIDFKPELRAEFQRFLDEPVDWHADGAPIKRRVTMDSVLVSMMEYGWMARAAWESNATPPQPAEPDMRAVCEALGFDPTNHHNAAKCPYCRPSLHQAAEPAPRAVAEPTFYLDEEMSSLLRDTIGADPEVNAIKLHIGDGHSGHGLYVSLAEHPEEGAIQLSAAPAPTPSDEQTRAAYTTLERLGCYWQGAGATQWTVPTGSFAEHRLIAIEALSKGHCINCGMDVDPKCACPNGRKAAARLSADGAVGEGKL